MIGRDIESGGQVGRCKNEKMENMKKIYMHVMHRQLWT